MKTNFTLFRNAISTLLLPLIINTFAADARRPAPAQLPAAPPKTSGVKFRPPPTGVSAVRVTGGSRGAGDKTISLDVLAPEDIGMTTQEQPSLYWFQSKPANAKFELTVVQENKVKPVVHMTVDRAAKAGIQSVKLSEFNAKLEPGVEYQWVVALISDPDNRSTDLIASGAIKRIASTPDLTEKLAKASPSTKAGIYADAGIWYDAIAALSDQIDATPTDKALRQSRAELLRQVGLKAAAQFEDAQ